MPYTFIGAKHAAEPAKKYGIDSKGIKKPPVPVFKVGDKIRHTAFGEGFVLSVSPMGGDALLEIVFNQSGTKRLMNNAASRYMTKIQE
jgi:DNA helicase-2/ATP-dependent DNA helicase PcrA